MRLKDDFNLTVLEEYGFRKIDKEQAERNDEFLLACYEYQFEMGCSRRGQSYHLVVSKEKTFHVFATEPDGSGDAVPMPDILIDMALDGIICR